MQATPRVTFRAAVPPTQAIRDRIDQHIAKLETYSDRIVKCHVTLDAPHRHHAHGRHYTVHIELVMPGSTLVVTRDPQACKQREDLNAAIDDAFDDAVRVVSTYARKHRDAEATTAY